MSNQSGTGCTCTEDGYSPDCPQAFIQGGKVLHTIEKETRLKPRLYIRDAKTGRIESSPESAQNVMDMLESEIAVLDVNPTEGSRTEKAPESVPCGRVSKPRPTLIPREYLGDGEQIYAESEYASSEHLRMGSNPSLDRFKPLTLNGVSMTAATIGGYRLDLEAVAMRAQKYVPLPPVCLPLIFRDADLNFIHHFFQGIEILLGRALVNSIAKAGSYSSSGPGRLLPGVKALVLSGYKDTDTELTIFIKRVLESTFDPSQAAQVGQTDDHLTVAANFYGFQYLEAGMRCREGDLGMWLHMAYNQYRTAWFNAFKSSGVPEFARDGVQDRYEEVEQVDAVPVTSLERNQIGEAHHPAIAATLRDLEVIWPGSARERRHHRESKHREDRRGRKSPPRWSIMGK